MYACAWCASLFPNVRSFASVCAATPGSGEEAQETGPERKGKAAERKLGFQEGAVWEGNYLNNPNKLILIQIT